MRGKYEKVNHRRKYWWIVAGILVLLIAALLIYHFTNYEQNNTMLIPDVAPDNMDENIEKIPNDTSTKDDSTNGASVRLTYSDEVTIDLRKETASLYFGNPGRSNQDMILQIVIQEEVIAQSDLIPAGYQLKTMDLRTDAASILQAGSYHGKFMIYYYDQETDELATINTEIPITVTVK